MKNMDETRPKSEKSSCSNLPMVLLKVVQVPVAVPQIQYIAVCDGKTSSLNIVCSETVDVPKSAVQR